MMARKCVIVLLDGLGDRSYAKLHHRTPLQAATTPNLDRLAANGACGLFHATFLGQPLPSEDAHFALFGYGLDEFPGRGALEAIGAGIDLAASDVAILAHLASVRSADEGLVLVEGELQTNQQEADGLFSAVNRFEADGFTFELIRTHRLFGILIVRGGASPFITDTDPLVAGRLLIEPQPLRSHQDDAATRRTARAVKAYHQFCRKVLPNHPANDARQGRGAPVANALVIQRPGRLEPVPSFRQRYGLRGLMIASGIILPGLANFLGMDCRKVKDSDQPDTDLAERITLAKEMLNDYDLIHVHTKVPDVAAHTKDPLNKVHAIEACDRGIGDAIAPLENDPGVVLVVTADHSTPSGGAMIHLGEPVPLLFHGVGVRRDAVDRFDEIAVAGGALSMVRGRELLHLILNHLDRAKLHGLMDTPEDQPYWPGDIQPYVEEEP
jgi:2,3-bisphosphoglycerate-independent phosphoglycerate mutase